jgi:hypothetical protein
MKRFYKMDFTLAALSTDGIAAGVSGAAFALTGSGAGDGCAHFVTVLNNTATDHGAKTLVLTGYDANNAAITETIAAPGTSATVTSTKAFKTLTSVVPSATIGADTFNIGWTAAAHTPFYRTGTFVFPMSVGAYVGGTINFTIQHTYDEITEDAKVFSQTALASKTANIDGTYTSPVNGVRASINSHTSGTLSLFVMY